MHVKDLTDFFQKMIWLICFGVSIREILREKIYKENTESRKKILQSCIF